MTNEDVLAIIRQELSQATTFGSLSGFGSVGSPTDIETPLEYYLGLPNGTEVEGRSQIMSTDVADAIEWILPQIMKAFTSTNEVVIFDAVSEEDEWQAELETEYVFNTLMKRNPGFIVLHQFVKDALMQRNGLVKVYYDNYAEELVDEYTGLSAEQFNMLIAQPNVQILNYSLTDDGLYTTRIALYKDCSKICVESVPLENFKLAADHNSLDLTNCRFSSHSIIKTLSDLREEGIDEKIVSQLSPASLNNSNYRFELQGESTQNYIPTNDDSQTPVRVEECFIKIDINGDGIAEFMKIRVAGEDTPTVILSMEPLNMSPWVATTAILMSHKFQGLSVYDRLKQIQDHKTAIWRNVLDNMYLQNNQMKEVVEGQVNMDDLLVSRAGGIVRVKKPGMINPLMAPLLGDLPIRMLAMLDETRAGRVGVSADGATAPQNIGDRVGSQGVHQLMTAKEELVGLIVRVIAETGIKPLCVKIRDLARQHIDTVESVKFKGYWQQTVPTMWRDRSTCTVRVGTGSGDKSSKLAAVQQVLALQAQLAASPASYLVDDIKSFAAMDDFCKFSGLNGAERYFVDPRTPAGQLAKQQVQQNMAIQQQKEEQQQLAILQIEAKLVQAELQKAQAQTDNVSLKSQVELAKHERELIKQEFGAKIAELEAKLTQMEMLANASEQDSQTEFKYAELDQRTFIELTKINAEKDLKILELGQSKDDNTETMQ